jgi:hypothetical protein
MPKSKHQIVTFPGKEYYDWQRDHRPRLYGPSTGGESREGGYMRHSVLAGTVLLATIIALQASQTSRGTGTLSQTSKLTSWKPPRTQDGQPDLQGVWLNNSATPLERPKALEGRSSLTDAEVANLKRNADRLFTDGNADLPVGDNLFLAALANPEQYRSPNGANRSATYMVQREFDHRTSLIVDPADGRIPALTPEAQQRRAALVAKERAPAGPEDLNNNTRCITSGVPRIGGVGADPQYGHYQIIQGPGYVAILMETIHDARIIPLDGRPHLPQSIRQWRGDSRGRWDDGGTLVVDTTNFAATSNFLGSSHRLHLVERFTRVSPDTIDYEVTADDPTTWTKPWTVLIHLKQMTVKIYEYACHEGNGHSMLAILAGARADERGR